MNGERLSPEGTESESYELKTDDVVVSRLILIYIIDYVSAA